MNNINRRITVFFFYDKDGIVRDFVFHLINSLKDISEYLLVVSNGKVANEYRELLLNCCDELYERENFGFDVWAYKEAFEHISWEKLKNYNELVLANFTCYGPIYPLSEMFDKMDKSDSDFWGVAKHPEQKNYLLPNKRGYINEHIMSYFTVVRRRMLTSPEFKLYWDNVPAINTKRESTAYHEVVFTKHFEELGFKSDSYVDLSKFKGRCNNSSIIKADELLINERCPLLKRRAFIFPLYLNNLNISFSNQAKDLIDYVKNNTNYDTKLIWKDILETTPLSIIKTNLQSVSISDTHNESCSKELISKHCIIIHVYKDTIFSVLNQVISYLPNNCNVLINSNLDDNSLLSNIANDKIQLISSNKTLIDFILSIQEIILKFDSVSVLALHNENNNKLSITDEEIYKYLSIVLFGSSQSLLYQIKNISCIDESNKGLYLPNLVNFAQYFGRTFCQLNKSLTKDLNLVSKALNLKVPVDTNPLTNGIPAFTTQTKLLLSFCSDLNNCGMSKTKIGQYKLFSQILPLWMQNNNLFTDWIITSTYAETELNNNVFMKHFLLDSLSKQVNLKIDHFRAFTNALCIPKTKKTVAPSTFSFQNKYEMLNYSYSVGDALKVFRRSLIRKIKLFFSSFKKKS